MLYALLSGFLLELLEPEASDHVVELPCGETASVLRESVLLEDKNFFTANGDHYGHVPEGIASSGVPYGCVSRPRAFFKAEIFFLCGKRFVSECEVFRALDSPCVGNAKVGAPLPEKVNALRSVSAVEIDLFLVEFVYERRERRKYVPCFSPDL